MRSMFSGVSGLRAHQTRMDVIGNNIANVNTVGFKSSRVTFQEVFTQTLKGSSAPDSETGRGGTNPMQVGLGISVASVDTLFTRGSLQRTDNPTDLAIEGDGFFIVRGGNKDTYRFTRAGNFNRDKLGNIVASNGMNVYGWQERKEGSTVEFDTEKEMQPLNIFNDETNGNKRILAASATTSAEFSGNLDTSFEGVANAFDPTSASAPYSQSDIDGVMTTATDADTFTVPYTAYDKLGNPYTINLTFVKNQVNAGTDTQWFWYADGTNSTGAPAQGYVEFDVNGKIIETSATAPVTQTITVLPNGSSATDSFDIEMDFSNLTQFKAESSVKATDVNGYPPGEMVNFNIGSDGVITGIYNNGQQQSLGLIALGFFENPAGLQNVGSNMFIPSTNSGEFTKGLKPGSGGVGTLTPGTLEMSNVDLSKEFTEMITTQRGFQANSRIITTSDEMLQELVSLKR